MVSDRKIILKILISNKPKIYSNQILNLFKENLKIQEFKKNWCKEVCIARK